MFFCFISAQNAEISFKSKNHDFGKIKEEDGLASTTFEFTNTGVAPLVVNGVTASCGCTTPEWTREPIPAGGKGFIKATYNAKGRPGPFKKSITVRSNASESTVVLTIGGDVIPRPKTVEEEYPVRIGDVRLKTRTTPLFDIYEKDSRRDKIQLKNTGKENVNLSFENVPKHIVMEAFPKTLKPNEEGSIEITYNAKNIHDFGVRADFAYLVLNDKVVKTEDYKIIVNSNIREDFRKMTQEEKNNAPTANFKSRTISLDVKKEREKTQIIELENTGKDKLIVRKIKIDKGISKASCSKASIAPGKSAILKVEVDGNKLTSENTYSRVTVITNDYKNPMTVIPVNVKLIK
jgi:hypothetical protein